MSGPQYVRLTATRVIVLPQKQNQQPQLTILNPPSVRLVPLPMQFFRNQGSGRCEMEFGGIVTEFAEAFEDVLLALEHAHDGGDLIARPFCPTQIQEAVGALSAQNLASAAAAGSSGSADILGRSSFGEKVVPIAGAGEGARWEDTGIPGTRELKRGDLGIFHAETGFQILAWDSNAEHPNSWALIGVPSELTRSFPSEDRARMAIRIAGYMRRLVERDEMPIGSAVAHDATHTPQDDGPSAA